MRSVVWRGFPAWRSDDEDATLTDVSTDLANPAVDELLTALAAEPRPHEVDGLGESLRAYRATFAAPQLVPATARRALVLTGLLSAKAAAAAGGVALGLAATAMAVAVNLPENDAARARVEQEVCVPEQPRIAGGRRELVCARRVNGRLGVADQSAEPTEQRERLEDDGDVVGVVGERECSAGAVQSRRESFPEACRLGKADLDARVERRLRRRLACGLLEDGDGKVVVAKLCEDKEGLRPQRTVGRLGQ